MYDTEKYYQAKDIDSAMRALSADPDAVAISGGSDVLTKIREGKLVGCPLVSIHRIRELGGISMEEDGTIVIGPVTTFSRITNNEVIQEYVPVLGDTVDMVGSLQLRNVGTVGGNVCNGVTSVDSVGGLCRLGAILVLTEPADVREMPISEWYTEPGRTVRAYDGLLALIKMEKENYESYGGHYIRYGKRGTMEIVTLDCVIAVKLSEGKKHIKGLRLGYDVTAPTPIRCRETEQSVIGMETGDTLAEKVGEGALSEISPRSSWRASKEFCLQLVEELGKRAVRQTMINVEGEWDA